MSMRWGIILPRVVCIVLREFIAPRPRLVVARALLTGVRGAVVRVADVFIVRGCIVVVRADTFFCGVSVAMRVLVAVRDVVRSRTLPSDCAFVARDTAVFFAAGLVSVSFFCRLEDTVFVAPRRVAARAMSDASSATAA